MLSLPSTKSVPWLQQYTIIEVPCQSCCHWLRLFSSLQSNDNRQPHRWWQISHQESPHWHLQIKYKGNFLKCPEFNKEKTKIKNTQTKNTTTKVWSISHNSTSGIKISGTAVIKQNHKEHAMFYLQHQATVGFQVVFLLLQMQGLSCSLVHSWRVFHTQSGQA